ncbi:hypothetical protein ETB97_002566 [Aspergillus alliaceus]|uniref:Malonyl-CoA:ACP transacylase (MAT) domain-containing protein n=1 Tax=Petromyces alliaceus TaxID=209559 RepID=A0A8H6A4B7_PETAA|nr:hypothetical protein ETB97_002566 [Aspergillus burnettii]
MVQFPAKSTYNVCVTDRIAIRPDDRTGYPTQVRGQSATDEEHQTTRQIGFKGNSESFRHGAPWGTAVGDPAEYDSIRSALGGPASGRERNLAIGSAKGFVGHAEGASDVISLTKVTMMMMQQRFIPLQASHTKMNHNINLREDDILEVVTDLRSWDDDHKVAIINNYGACGSNASMIVAQAKEPSSGISRSPDENRQYPFWIPGLDSRAITAYCTKLASYLSSLHKSPNSLADISFNKRRQSNHAAGITKVKAERPVILCFGGQVSLFVRLDRKLYDGITIFRQHLDRVDSVMMSLGEPSIFPDIFSREPVQNPVKLQTMLSRITAVVGHSFGEITALCVAGALKLQDTVRLVIERAKLVRDSWEPESGAMMAVEADESVVHELVQEANRTPNSDGSVSIACYNGPRSFTLAGTTAAVDAVQLLIHGKFPHIRSKRLSVTNAFHSKLVEKLAEGYFLEGWFELHRHRHGGTGAGSDFTTGPTLPKPFRDEL